MCFNQNIFIWTISFVHEIALEMYRRKEMWTRGPDWELVYHRLKYWSASLSDFNVPPSVKKSWTYMKGNFLHAAGGLCFWSHSCPLNCPNCPNLLSKCLHLHVKYFPWSRRYTGHKYTLYLPSSSTTNKKFSFPSLFGPPLNSWAEKQSREEKSIFLEETWPLGPDYQAMTSVKFFFHNDDYHLKITEHTDYDHSGF